MKNAMRAVSPKWMPRNAAILFFALFTAAQPGNASERPTIRRDDLGIAIIQIHRNYQSAVTTGFENEPEISAESEVPLKYWTDGIKALNPAKIYQHLGNIAVVLRIRDGAEQGWYVPTSPSFREPFLGIQQNDGFVFTDHDRGHGYAFERSDKKQTFESASASPDLISGAGLQAYHNYGLALNRGEEKSPAVPLFEIPDRYWPDLIKSLKPVKLYEHFLNVAIVLRIRNGVEEGFYVSNPISSFMPIPGIKGEDGFEFMQVPSAESRINFRRAMETGR